MRKVGSFAMVHETENEREREEGRGVKRGTLEGGDLRWVNLEEAETDGLKVEAVPEVAITESFFISLFFSLTEPSKFGPFKNEVYVVSSVTRNFNKGVGNHISLFVDDKYQEEVGEKRGGVYIWWLDVFITCLMVLSIVVLSLLI